MLFAFYERCSSYHFQLDACHFPFFSGIELYVKCIHGNISSVRFSAPSMNHRTVNVVKCLKVVENMLVNFDKNDFICGLTGAHHFNGI